MKASIIIKSLLLAGLAGASAFAAQPAPAPKIVVVDLAKLFEGYYATADQTASLNAQKAKADEMVKPIAADRETLILQYKGAEAAFNNPASSNETKAQAQQNANSLMALIQGKNNELQNISNNFQNVVRQQFASFKEAAVIKITDVATEIAKKQGANMLIDSSKSTTYGTSSFLFIDASYPDITPAVLAEINKGHPMPAATPATPAAGAPSVTFPPK